MGVVNGKWNFRVAFFKRIQVFVPWVWIKSEVYKKCIEWLKTEFFFFFWFKNNRCYSSIVDHVWRLLRFYLETHEEKGQVIYHRCIVNRLLSNACSLPNWLLTAYKVCEYMSYWSWHECHFDVNSRRYFIKLLSKKSYSSSIDNFNDTSALFFDMFLKKYETSLLYLSWSNNQVINDVTNSDLDSFNY